MTKINILFFVCFFSPTVYSCVNLFDSTKVYIGRIEIKEDCPIPQAKKYIEFVFTFLENKSTLKLINYSTNFNGKKQIENIEEILPNRTKKNRYLFIPENSKFQLSIKIKKRKSILIIKRIKKIHLFKKQKQRVVLHQWH